MPSNGRLTSAELSPIRPYGELANDAAAGWEAPHGPADSGLEPTGPELSTYRSIAGQESTWNAYIHGGPLAAPIGSSVHGLGKAVDLKLQWMRSWIDDHGRKFGWAKTEAFSEWWHVNFIGGVSWVLFDVLKHGMRGKRVVWYTKRLAFIHPEGKRHGYLNHSYWKFKDDVAAAVRQFQKDHGLAVDGQIGEDTAHTISAVFHKQYVARNKKRRLVRGDDGKLHVQKGGRKRLARDVARLRP